MLHLTTPRLQLQQMTVADATAVGEMYLNQALATSYELEPLYTFSEKKVFTNRIISECNAIWTIRFLSQPHNIIGDCALHHYEYLEKQIEIGGTLLPEYWGQGIMAEAFLAIMQYAISTYEIAHFIAKTTWQNTKAMRFAQKAGFKIQEGNNTEVVMIKQV